jgi:transcriptional regulator
VRAFEARFGFDWEMSTSYGYFNEILPSVGAFEVEVTDVQSMFKLSQEQSPELRERVLHSLPRARPANTANSPN